MTMADKTDVHGGEESPIPEVQEVSKKVILPGYQQIES